MSSATLTLVGLYQYGLSKDINIFDKLSLPEGIDHDTTVDNILHNCADFEVLYPDLDFMAEAVEMFSTKWQRTFTRWLAALTEDYKPLANYDRIEEWSDSTSSSESELTSSRTSDSSGSSENISAFNNDYMRPNTSASSYSDTGGRSNVDRLNSSLAGHSGHIWGNIGVMTTQAILKEEIEVDKINIYDLIMVCFAREFLIPFTY